jgi:sugar-specific transcriptional regulator TrmB
MTQEELDALMNGDVDSVDETSSDEMEADDNDDDEVGDIGDIIEEGTLPLPATAENKMVHQLDDVTKESEEKATEIFDIIENISSDLMDREETLNEVIEVINSNIELFTTLSEKFPDIDTFKSALEKNESALDNANEVVSAIQDSGDAIMNVMDIMQYQDIHRQKIERVINVMRSLSKYMNTLFEGAKEDSKRVSSAKHIIGDTHNELASTDDIEALLDQFANK